MSTFQSVVRSLSGIYTQGPATTVPVSASTLTLSPSLHGGRILNITAATTTITLPAVNVTAFSPTTGPGQNPDTQNNQSVLYTFMINSPSTAVKVITGTGDFLQGAIILGPSAGGATSMFYANGTTIRSINLNGTTTGGADGSMFTIFALSANTYAINGVLIGSGTLATPFATS
jgi:hypothetical protein